MRFVRDARGWAFLVSVLVLLAAAPAHAAPPFFWMNDLNRDSRVGGEFTIGNPPTGVSDDSLTITADLIAHVAVARSIVLNARLPLAFSFFENDANGDDIVGTGIGNVSLGATGIKVLRGGGTSVRLGGGGLIYLPTASDSGDSGLAATAARILTLPDPGRWIDATTLRFRGDFLMSAGAFFLQAEANLDLFFGIGDDVDLNIGLGPGIELSSVWSILVELSITNITDDELLTVDAGLRYDTGSVLVGAHLYLPTEEIAAHQVFGAGVDVSARF